MDERSEESLAEEMTGEVLEGVEGTGVRCGIIGEIGCEIPTDNELKVLRAAARAQRATGAAVTIHTMFLYTKRDAGLKIVGEIEKAGADLTRVMSGMVAQWPTDTQRIQEVKRLIDDGWIGQILLSQDVCIKLMTRKYGGWGYAHILDVLVPRFRMEGVSAKAMEMETLMVENPRRLLALAA